MGSNSNHSPTYRVLICGALKRFGFDPATFVAWWAQVDSNHRPRAYQARALTTWAMSPFSCLRCISSYSRSRYFYRWWRWWESNPWPPACRAGALPAELHPHLGLFKWIVNSEEFSTLSLFLILSDLRSLKIEQQQTYTSLKPLLYLIVRKIYVFTFLVLVYFQTYELSVTPLLLLTFSIERRWSSRTFRYGYLVTT